MKTNKNLKVDSSKNKEKDLFLKILKSDFAVLMAIILFIPRLIKDSSKL